ncbi:Cut8 proteasome-binding domain-containing protein [Madurella fahalii]|uniref:Cut8 proteasome-binding domain-containing protein n=1 Tax=Madurella fahalii TaxID=1157608 RepID=A0ABQ0FZY1_9PEZI
MAAASFRVPQISQAEMIAFHEAHFSKLATGHFQSHFLRPDLPAPEEAVCNDADGTNYDEYHDEEEDDDDDGLGYYPDGVKRTLTDEQIAIFRHSELEALRRAKESSNTRKSITTVPREDAAHDVSEGEVSSSTPTGTAARNKKKRKRGKNKNKNKNGEEQIDLRKRTWDMVDKGLATLDYDEEEAEPAQAGAVQRRRISYDD